MLGLPIPASRSPPGALEAYQIKEVVTAQGVYTYDQAAGYYSYKPHSKIAAEARDAHSEFLKQLDEKDWQRHVQSYELGTQRLKALSGYFWRRWWW
jgi:hypothetical protein